MTGSALEVREDRGADIISELVKRRDPEAPEGCSHLLPTVT